MKFIPEIKLITLDEVYRIWFYDTFYPMGQKYKVLKSYQNYYRTFSEFCDYIKKSGYKII